MSETRVHVRYYGLVRLRVRVSEGRFRPAAFAAPHPHVIAWRVEGVRQRVEGVKCVQRVEGVKCKKKNKCRVRVGVWW